MKKWRDSHRRVSLIFIAVLILPALLSCSGIKKVWHEDAIDEEVGADEVAGEENKSDMTPDQDDTGDLVEEGEGYACSGDGDCPDDGDPCNGEEYCDTGTHECSRHNVPADGTECNAEPRKICLGGACLDSTCGDGFVDHEQNEECDDQNVVGDDGCRNDCTYSCHNDGDCDDFRGCSIDSCDSVLTHSCRHYIVPEGMTCRSSTGDCDVEERCDGANADCPTDALVPAATSCRRTFGSCDLEDFCTGTLPDCPDSYKSDTEICRPSTGFCDVEERCTGLGPDCPVDAFKPLGDLCDDGHACTSSDQCNGSGACQGIPFTCNAVNDGPRTIFISTGSYTLLGGISIRYIGINTDNGNAIFDILCGENVVASGIEIAIGAEMTLDFSVECGFTIKLHVNTATDYGSNVTIQVTAT